MGGALRQLDGLLRGGGSQRHMCVLIVFVVAVFLVLWRLIQR